MPPTADGVTPLADRMICDDCGNGAQMVQSDLLTRGIDILCWKCAFNRTLAVAMKLAEEAGEGPPDA